jgi:hypothetical protein
MNKYLQRLLILLIFISAASATYLFSNPKNNNSSPPPPTLITSTESSTPEVIIPARLKNNLNSSSKNTRDTDKKNVNNITPPPTLTANTPTSSPPLEKLANTIPTTFIINNEEYQLNVAPETTAYDAMIQLRESQQISFTSKKFSSLGRI